MVSCSVLRANTVSVASELYSAKRNKPSRSCEANGRPCGIYKIAAGGETPLCLGRLPLRRPFAHSRHLRCRTWRIGNGRRNPALPWPPSITAAIRTQSPPAVSDTAKRQREAERLPYGVYTKIPLCRGRVARPVSVCIRTYYNSVILKEQCD